MRIISKRCLGLDLHKKQITAHLRVQRGSDQEPLGEDLRFGTMPDDLERLRQWIIDLKVEDVVMESTSVYWMHLYELIEDVTRPLVANASHVKKVPGRKTDIGDAQWLAELGAHGLLRPSFVPPKEIRGLRSVARYRTRNHHLKRICVQIAWAASRKKGSFLRVRFLRLQNRIGRNKAVVALARQMLVLIYHVLSGKPYTDLGATFYDEHDKVRAVDRYTQKLAALGYNVQLLKKST